MSSFRRILSNRHRLPSPSVTLENTLLHKNHAKTNFLQEHFPSPEINKKGFLRRFLHRNAITQLPEILSLPVGDKLREKLKIMSISGDRLQLKGLAPPVPEGGIGVSVEDVRKLMRVSQFEKVKKKLREVKVSSVSYKEFVEFCVEECGNEEKGVEFAKELDQSGNVVVMGNVVFLRPDQLAKSMENILSELMPTPNDPRRKQLEQLEEQKVAIDQRARTQVANELYCGLGLLLVQTLGFMRLTFWELSWDVMEPICFFVTSLHFALAYGFFLRTSTEPSFEGYFQRRFRTKQQKLMKLHNFDIEKYRELRMAFYPNLEHGLPLPTNHKPCEREVGLFASSIRG